MILCKKNPALSLFNCTEKTNDALGQPHSNKATNTMITQQFFFL